MSTRSGPGHDRPDPSLNAIVSERRQLINLAYRLLGSLAEAEDAVQETYARWYAMSGQQREAIQSPGGWLTTVASRICLDLLGSARARRERTPGVGELLSRLTPPSQNSVLRFAHHAAREKATLARYPDLVDLFVAGFRDPIADRVARAEIRVFVSPFALLSPSGFRRRSRVRPDELRQLAMPTLVIWGQHEPLGSVAIAQELTDLIPHARLIVLPSGHGPWLGYPGQTAGAIADFVRRQESVPPGNRAVLQQMQHDVG